MGEKVKVILSEMEIESIQNILTKGMRIELIPISDGRVRVIKIKRQEMRFDVPEKE